MENLGKRIYGLRKGLGLTLEEVGHSVGVSKSTVRKWEQGIIANMRRDKIKNLATVLHTTPAYLMGWTDDPYLYDKEEADPADGDIGLSTKGKSTLRDRIKQFRLAQGLTLAQVADAIGVKEATAQRYESGDIKNIKQETIFRLSELFSVSPAYLMGWTDEPYLYDKEKTAPADGDGLSPLDAQLMDLLRFLTDDQKKMLLAQIDTLLKSQ